MTEEVVVQALHKYFASLFPKFCPNCNRNYATLSEYIQITKRIGPSISYDADSDDWDTRQPIGSAALANCPRGTTLALTTEDMELPQRLALLHWVQRETERRGLNASELLDYLRDEIRRRVLAESKP